MKPRRPQPPVHRTAQDLRLGREQRHLPHLADFTIVASNRRQNVRRRKQRCRSIGQRSQPLRRMAHADRAFRTANSRSCRSAVRRTPVSDQSGSTIPQTRRRDVLGRRSAVVTQTFLSVQRSPRRPHHGRTGAHARAADPFPPRPNLGPTTKRALNSFRARQTATRAPDPVSAPVPCRIPCMFFIPAHVKKRQPILFPLSWPPSDREPAEDRACSFPETSLNTPDVLP